MSYLKIRLSQLTENDISHEGENESVGEKEVLAEMEEIGLEVQHWFPFIQTVCQQTSIEYLGCAKHFLSGKTELFPPRAYIQVGETNE